VLPRWLMVVFWMLTEAWSTRRDARIRFLQVQVELLRQRVSGNRVILTPEDRSRLLKLGASLDHRVDDLIGIVSVKTYKTWLREQRGARQPGRVGRRRVIPPSLRALIKRLASENGGWGVRRIVGELRKLALTPSRSTVRRVLVDEGLLPDPERQAPRGVTTPWRTFVRMHVNTMVACDFFCKTVWTPMGKHMAYVLAFVHLGSRKVVVSPSTLNPNDDWMRQQARNALMWADEEGIDLRYLLHDRDTKFTESFNHLFKDGGVRIVRAPYQTPIANCFAESWIGSLKRECLNHFACFSLRHLDYIVQTYVGYYNHLRPHQGVGNRPLTTVEVPIPLRSPNRADAIGPIRRRAYLGGLLNHYERKAA
jgi:putative transposase